MPWQEEPRGARLAIWRQCTAGAACYNLWKGFMTTIPGVPIKCMDNETENTRLVPVLSAEARSLSWGAG